MMTQSEQLHFGAIDWQAVVWINGQRLGGHKGGYDPFSFDITDALNKTGRRKSSSASGIRPIRDFSRAENR